MQLLLVLDLAVRRITQAQWELAVVPVLMEAVLAVLMVAQTSLKLEVAALVVLELEEVALAVLEVIAQEPAPEAKRECLAGQAGLIQCAGRRNSSTRLSEQVTR